MISVPTPTTLPILALADYTTAHGVPTAMALASQAKISPVKHEEIIDAADDDNNSMSTDEYNPTRTELNASTKTRTKSTRMKSGKSNSSSSKSSAQQAAADAIQYGPLLVKPRKSVAPTLANGRRSKDAPVSE